MPQQNDEFYIGYLPQAPAQITTRVRKFVLAAFGVAALAAFALVSAQKPFAASFFEFLQPREFSGLLISKPHPTLKVLRPGKHGHLPAYSRYYLVGQGKFGVAAEAAEWDSQFVQLRGKLIYRDDQTMIEVEPRSLSLQTLAVEPPAHATQTATLGNFTLRGEIVDSKCFFGVMNPGDLKTHKSCAVRCIAGGSPPVFIVRQAHEEVLYLMLLSPEGHSTNQKILDYVARPLEISGQVWQYDNLLTLRADPAMFRALD